MYGRLLIVALSLIVVIPFIENANAQPQIQIDPTSVFLNDNGNYVPYKLTQNSTSITINSMEGSYVFDKNACSISFYNGTNTNHKPVIGSDVYSVLASFGNTGVWNPVSIINNAACNTVVTENSGTVTITGIKAVSGAGIFSINYTKAPMKPLKLTFSATNQNPAWTNYHVGMKETIQVPQTLSLDNQTFDLSKYNNTVVNRSWIAAHSAQLLKLSNNTRYDMGIGWNNVEQITVHYINNKAYLQIDYIHNTPILSPGSTITVDPSITTDTTANTSIGGVALSKTLAITVGSNSNRVLIVGISGADLSHGTSKVSTVTLGAQSFTQGPHIQRNIAAGPYSVFSEIWYLPAPTTGAGTITVTFDTAAGAYYGAIGAYSLYNVNQTSPIGATNSTDSTSSATSRINLTPTGNNSWLIDSISEFNTGATQPSAPTPGTQAWNTGTASADFGASQYYTTPTKGTKTTIQWTTGVGAANTAWEEAAVEVKSITNVPATPTLTKVNTLNSTAINATFTKPTGTTFNLLYITLSGGATTHINTTNSFVLLNNYTAGSKYTFQAFAGNSSGTSSGSVTKYNYTYNIAPTSLTASSITSSQARISWTNPSGNVTGGFKVYKVTALGSNYTLLASTSNSTNHYDPTSLLGNREYSFKLATRYAVGTNYTGASANSTIVTFYTLPNSPTGLGITQTTPLIAHLSWTNGGDNGTLLGTKIEDSPNGLSWSTALASTGNSTNMADIHEPSGGVWFFRVSAIKYGGTSAPSSVASLSLSGTTTIIGHKANNSTIVVGNILQYNLTSSNNVFPLVYGNATMNGLANLQNFSLKDSATSFITGKSLNINVTKHPISTIVGDDYIVDCPYTIASTNDLEVFDANNTDGHYITLASAPNCMANNTMTWHVYFKPNGKSASSYTTTVRVKVLNNTFGANPSLFTANGTTVPTAYAAPWILSNSMTVGSGLNQYGIYYKMQVGINPAYVPINFTAGGLNVTGSNLNTLPIIITSTKPNSSSTLVTFTYPNTMNLQVTSRFTLSNSTIVSTGLPQTVVDAAHVKSTILYKNNTNDIIQIRAKDLNSGQNASYSLQQNMNEIPLVTQILNFKNGTYGTYGMLGALDVVTLFVIILSMLGLNRVNETLGLVINIMVIGAASAFGIVSFPSVMIPAIALILLVTIGSTKKLPWS